MKYSKFLLLMFVFFVQTNAYSASITKCINQPATLNWSAAGNITSCTPSYTDSACAFTASPVPGSGSTLVYATTTCTATLVCTGPGGTSTSTDQLPINQSQIWNGSSCSSVVPTSVTVSPTTATIVLGQSVNFTVNAVGSALTSASLNWKAPGQSQWNWQNGSYGATVTPGNGYSTFASTGNKSITYSFTPTVVGTYTIYGAALDWSSVWTQSPNYTVTVTAAPTASLNISPSASSAGGPVVITWSSTNAGSCTGTGFSTGNATSNSTGVTMNPTTTTTYSINCGGAISTKTVTVTAVPSGLSISAYPKTLPAGSTASLSWSIANASTSCMISAQPVCAGTCSSARTTAAAAINTILQTGNVDTNDIYSQPATPRTIKNAIQTPAPSNNPTGLKAMGKKSVPLRYTTDFILDCGAGTPLYPLTPKKVRVNVSTDSEG